MLKRFEVSNFKNFKQTIALDFSMVGGYQFCKECITDSLLGKILIYGRNATGKTNFGKAIMDITSVLNDGYVQFSLFMNEEDLLSESTVFCYTFGFGVDEIRYEYHRGQEQEIQFETLSINDRMIYKCDFSKKTYDFSNLGYIGAETLNTDRFLKSNLTLQGEDNISGQRLSFLRWLLNNSALKQESLLLRMEAYVKCMRMFRTENALPNTRRPVKDVFFENLNKGDELKRLEEFLNAMGVECKLWLEKLPDGKKELYFKNEKLLPFYENASSGTLALVEFYRRLNMYMEPISFLYMDEFDAFYHYEMAENVVKYMQKAYPQCQIIMTSHNTNLMTNRLMRPDCLFILSRAGKLTALCNATLRELREGHNLEKMYISGEFEQYE